MTIKIVAFGIAKEIIGMSEMEFEMATTSSTIGELRKHLEQDFPAFTSLASLKFAVKESYQSEAFELNNGDEVVILPPVSGG